MTHTRTIDVDERAAFWAQQNRRALSVRDKYDLDDVDDEIEAIADTYLRVKADHDNYKAALSHMERERDALTARRDELLATIARISQTVPLESEVAEALNQRGAMLAEIGTLRAERDEWKRLAELRGVEAAKWAHESGTAKGERDFARSKVDWASKALRDLKTWITRRGGAQGGLLPYQVQVLVDGIDAEINNLERTTP